MADATQTEKEPKTSPKNDRVRVQFDFSESSLDSLDKLRANFGAASRAEIVRRALMLLNDYVVEENRGSKLGFMKSDGTFAEIRFY